MQRRWLFAIKKKQIFFTAILETQLSLENKAVLFLLPGLGLGLHF